MPEIKHRVILDTNLWISFLLTNNQTELDLFFSNKQLTLLSDFIDPAIIIS